MIKILFKGIKKYDVVYQFGAHFLTRNVLLINISECSRTLSVTIRAAESERLCLVAPHTLPGC